ncbi:uncharacterized protein LOC18423926 [Amborella trichopoda]|nr:uncharacterized protein LOC18423926 [Amborella trichopoda]|eukprot:XP_006828604.2 uncharacterized protein LOC18423926 [Amborella trichopoda]
MLKRAGSLFLPHLRVKTPLYSVLSDPATIGCGMALNQHHISSNLLRSDYSFLTNNPRKFYSVGRINGNCRLNLKSYFDHGLFINGGFGKMPPHKLAYDSKIAMNCSVKSTVKVDEAVETKPINGFGDFEHRSPLRFLDRPMPQKLNVAVDVDEVLGSFLSALNKFIAARYASNHLVSEYHVYEFFRIWNCSRSEADIRVHEFFTTPYFKTGIHPIPGARRALMNMSTYCNLSVVTSRQNAIKDHTIEWIEKHYPGLFQEIHFGNHFALDGKSRPKSEICRSLGAQVLIDDNPRYALECAEEGMKVLLFDYDNTYPWSKTGSATSHPLVTKVHNWQEVEQQLTSWVPS